MATRTRPSELQWSVDRWHLYGKGIHAGDGMEMRFPDGEWVEGRIESQECGRRLLFYFVHHGMTLRVTVDTEDDLLRWPEARRR